MQITRSPALSARYRPPASISNAVNQLPVPTPIRILSGEYYCWRSNHSSPDLDFDLSLSPCNKRDNSSITTDHPRNDIGYPPPVAPTRCVPLPPLSTCPVFLNPILGQSPSPSPIIFNISQCSSTAILSDDTVHNNTVTYPQSWREQPAMYPHTVGSMTLRFGKCPSLIIPISSRPIVVFPVSPFDSVVTVNDVLKAVSRAAGIAIREGQSSRSGQHRRLRDQAVNGTTTTVLDVFRSDCALWWAGLYPSPTERDVWILDINHERYGHDN